MTDLFYPNYICKEHLEDVIEHHGILGQKWGKKQGPPYPLDAGDHSKREVKEGYKKSIGGGRNEELYDRKSKKSDTKTKKKEKITKEDIANHRKEMIAYYKKNGDKNAAKLYEEVSDDVIAKELRNKEIAKKALIIAGTAIGLSAAAYIIYKRKSLNNIAVAKDFMANKAPVDKADDILKNFADKGLDLDTANKLMTLKMNGEVVKDKELVKVIKDGIMKDMDITLKDAQFKRIDFNKGFTLDKVKNPLFVSMTEKDADIYKRVLPNRIGPNGVKQQVILDAFKDIKVPSRQKATEIIKDLKKTDPNFENDMLEAIQHIIKKNTGITYPISEIKASSKIWDMKGKDYTAILALGGNNVNFNNKMSKAFLDRGYNAVFDMHDIKDNLSDLPLIMLNPQDLITKNILKV